MPQADHPQEASACGGTLLPETMEAAQPVTTARLVECHYCGEFQQLPALLPDQTARCARCRSVLRRTHKDTLRRAMALYLACASLFAVACLLSLMTVSTTGMTLSADLFSGPQGLGRNGLWPLSVVVLATTFAAPFAKLVCTLYVLIGLRLPHPPRHLRMVFSWVERLSPWSMIEVYLLGVFVAYTKLIDLVHIDIGDALYALIVLMLTTVAADAVMDRQAVWDEMERRGIPEAEIDHAAMARTADGQLAIGCEVCGLVCVVPMDQPGRCHRCGSRLHERKPNSISRTWALVLTSAVLYIPANIYPVLQVIQLGSRRAKHHPGRRGGAAGGRDVSARGTGLLRQHPRADAETRGADHAAAYDAARMERAAS